MKRLLAFSAASLLAWAMAQSKPVDLTLRGPDGSRVSLRDYRGKIVVLNFWATWCGPCKQEFPLLVETEREMRARGVVFIAVSLDERRTRAAIPEFVKRFGAGFPIWTGATSDDLDRFKMGEVVPATAFLDEDGSIAARVSGEIRKAELIERLDWLLGGKSGPAPKAFVSHSDNHKD